MNSVVIVTGGSWSNIMHGWVSFLYMQTPSILLFLTSKNLRSCYWKFIWPVKTSPKPKKINVAVILNLS
uniref:Uncharacterized protein n=1 Tax=Acrobeloides nanus TaxID=290746 RepID=A0A914C8M2_9BILA